MNTDDVWQMVERARADVHPDDDAETIASRMVGLLAERDPSEIAAFDKPLWELIARSYRADLWAAAYIINGGASDDGFDYFRGWLISQGRSVYEAALAAPDSLAELPAVVRAQEIGEDLWGEGMIGVAWQAHRAATGQELPRDDDALPFPDLDPAWDFDFDDHAEMRRRLPGLASLYFGPPDD